MAMKIKDGLFIGDAETSQSEDFINDNKISNLINLAGREVPNIWAPHGLVYMTFNWEDRPDFKLGLNVYKHPSNIGPGDFISDMVEFIDISIMHGISVLLFSRNGTGRCTAAICIYLMVKYRWGFEKAFEYVYSKKPDVNLNRGFVQQLYAFDKHLLLLHAGPEHNQFINSKQDSHDPSASLSVIASTVLSKNDYSRWKDWNPAYLMHKDAHDADYDKDELILVYSYINSKVSITALPGPYRAMLDAPAKHSKLRFTDYKGENTPRPQYPLRGILKKNGKKDQKQDIPDQMRSTREDDYRDQSIGVRETPRSSHEDKANPSSRSNGQHRPQSNGSSSMRDYSSNGAMHDDLYGFVGVDSEPKPSHSNDNQNRQGSAEERLRKLMDGLTQNGRNSATSSITNSNGSSSLNFTKNDLMKTSQEKEIDLSEIYGRNRSDRSVMSNGSLSSDIRRGLQTPQPESNTSSSRRIDSRQDAVKAYEEIQKSRVTKARHDSNTILPTRSTAVKAAWTDNPIASSSQSMKRPTSDDAVSIDSSILSANTNDKNVPAKQYRHGSPAPRSQQRVGSTIGSSRSSPMQQTLRPPSPAKPPSRGSPSPSRNSQDSTRSHQISASNANNQSFRRRGSGSSLGSSESIEPDNGNDYKSKMSTSSRLSGLDGYRVMSNTPNRQSSRTSVDMYDAGTSRRYASPQVTKSSSRGMFDTTPIVAGRSSTPTRATWKY